MVTPKLYDLCSLTQKVKSIPARLVTGVQFLGQENLLESNGNLVNILAARKIPWTEEPSIHRIAKS